MQLVSSFDSVCELYMNISDCFFVWKPMFYDYEIYFYFSAEGDESKSGELETKLNEIEERAEELDRRRTHTISSVALINDRNRKANVSKAEEAIRLEMRREKKEGKVDNPFKRRKCNPRMVTKVSEMEAEQTSVKEKDTQELKRKVEQATS